MFKKSTTNKQLGLFTTASSLMCKRESKQYEDEKEWHMQFYRNVTCNIDEDVFRPLFDEKMGCPTKAIRQLVAMSILKEGAGCSDETLYENCRYNLLWRAALGLFNIDDQCGVVMYLDSENWLKGSIEYENEQFQHLGSVATNNGYSDWATTAIPADVKSMWYRLSRREDDFCIECSTDGNEWNQMRVCHMYEAKDNIRFGIYACSPEESSFKAVFTDMQITECMWKAHDGQQPDKE